MRARRRRCRWTTACCIQERRHSNTSKTSQLESARRSGAAATRRLYQRRHTRCLLSRRWGCTARSRIAVQRWLNEKAFEKIVTTQGLLRSKVLPAHGAASRARRTGTAAPPNASPMWRGAPEHGRYELRQTSSRLKVNMTERREALSKSVAETQRGGRASARSSSPVGPRSRGGSPAGPCAPEPTSRPLMAPHARCSWAGRAEAVGASSGAP